MAGQNMIWLKNISFMIKSSSRPLSTHSMLNGTLRSNLKNTPYYTVNSGTKEQPKYKTWRHTNQTSQSSKWSLFHGNHLNFPHVCTDKSSFHTRCSLGARDPALPPPKVYDHVKIGIPPDLKQLLDTIKARGAKRKITNKQQINDKYHDSYNDIKQFFKYNMVKDFRVRRERFPWYRQETLELHNEMSKRNEKIWSAGIKSQSPTLERTNAVLGKLQSAWDHHAASKNASSKTCRVVMVNPVRNQLNYKNVPGFTTFMNGVMFVNELEVNALTDNLLAQILAHEMTHACLNHSAEVLCYEKAFLLIRDEAACALLKSVPKRFMQHAMDTIWFLIEDMEDDIFPPPSMFELEADKVGLQIMQAAGFDSSELGGTRFAEYLDGCQQNITFNIECLEPSDPDIRDRINKLQTQKPEIIEFANTIWEDKHPGHEHRQQRINDILQNGE